MVTAWAAEHHGLEFWHAPNPLTILTDWAARTTRIRLGVGVAVAPYWHPLRLAGEAGLVDIYSDGRLELGISRGAFNFEFARMANGITPEEGRSHVFEMVPLLKKLWAGDVEHRGKHWSFPTVTSAPKPLQKPHPPLWLAARDPRASTSRSGTAWTSCRPRSANRSARSPPSRASSPRRSTPTPARSARAGWCCARSGWPSARATSTPIVPRTRSTESDSRGCSRPRGTSSTDSADPGAGDRGERRPLRPRGARGDGARLARRGGRAARSLRGARHRRVLLRGQLRVGSGPDQTLPGALRRTGDAVLPLARADERGGGCRRWRCVAAPHPRLATTPAPTAPKYLITTFAGRHRRMCGARYRGCSSRFPARQRMPCGPFVRAKWLEARRPRKREKDKPTRHGERPDRLHLPGSA